MRSSLASAGLANESLHRQSMSPFIISGMEASKEPPKLAHLPLLYPRVVRKSGSEVRLRWGLAPG